MAKSQQQNSQSTQLSYFDRLTQSPSDQLQSELFFEVQKAKSQWEVSIAQTKAELDRAKYNLERAKSRADISAVVTYFQEIQSMEEALLIVQEVFNELFPA